MTINVLVHFDYEQTREKQGITCMNCFRTKNKGISLARFVQLLTLQQRDWALIATSRHRVLKEKKDEEW